VTFLIDTNVLSEIHKRVPNPGVDQWFSDTPPEELRISVLTVGEVGNGITQLRERGDGQQAAHFQVWLDDVVAAFGDRIAPVTMEIAWAWSMQSGRQPIAVVDGLIAATAHVHGWTVATRNVKHFELVGVRVVNPFSGEG
jgi:predicted nucleic acid-binding protein